MSDEWLETDSSAGLRPLPFSAFLPRVVRSKLGPWAS